MTTPTVFISYSWDSEDHCKWVLALATRLRKDGVDVKLDKWELVAGDVLPEFMERSIRDNDFVLIVCTPQYKKKSEERVGGVGYEGFIITSELYTDRNHRKFIPIWRSDLWKNAAPSWLAAKLRIDLTEDSDREYENLLNTLYGNNPSPPPLGLRKPNTGLHGELSVQKITAPTITVSSNDEIKLIGIIQNEVTSPRNDGTEGSALYKIPFRLSARPSTEWVEVFVENWNHPPEYTLMHRPGIASVTNDKVILDGTTIEEVETYHLKTLKLAITVTNAQIAEWQRKQRERREAEKNRRDAHEAKVDDVAKRLNFD